MGCNTCYSNNCKCNCGSKPTSIEVSRQITTESKQITTENVVYLPVINDEYFDI